MEQRVVLRFTPTQCGETDTTMRTLPSQRTSRCGRCLPTGYALLSRWTVPGSPLRRLKRIDPFSAACGSKVKRLGNGRLASARSRRRAVLFRCVCWRSSIRAHVRRNCGRDDVARPWRRRWHQHRTHPLSVFTQRRPDTQESGLNARRRSIPRKSGFAAYEAAARMLHPMAHRAHTHPEAPCNIAQSFAHPHHLNQRQATLFNRAFLAMNTLYKMT